jgi:hypothetical protein
VIIKNNIRVGGNNVNKCMKIVGCVLAAVGVAYVIKHIKNHKEGFCSCGCHKIKVEDEKSAGETVSDNSKTEEEKRTGSRYGSNPIRY